MFWVAGFRPGRRGPFVSAKGPKTIDAQPGLIEFGGRKLYGGRANSLRSDKARLLIRSPTKGRAAGIEQEQGSSLLLRVSCVGMGKRYAGKGF